MTMNEAAKPETRERIVEVAERLFRQVGFQKTTVSDIARELHMSPANVYRFFNSKAQINQAVGRLLMGGIEAAARAIAGTPQPAVERLRELLVTVEKMTAERYIGERKLHEMVAFALSENWPIVEEHITHMRAIIEGIVRDGVASGEFAPVDAVLAGALVYTACIRWAHPGLMVECADTPTPTIEEMADFCLAGLRHGFAKA
jgi:AcrR family transcriptional regulator